HMHSIVSATNHQNGTFAFEAVSLQGQSSSASLTLTNIALDPNNDQTASTRVRGIIGQPLTLEEQLILTATSSSSFLDPGPHTSVANGLDTADVFVDVLTPSVTYTTASGGTYFSPAAAPEPSIFILFFIGIVGMLVRSKLS